MSSYYDLFQKINQVNISQRQKNINDTSDFFLDTFKDAPEYEQVKLGQNDTYDPNIYDAWVYDGDSYKKLVNEDTIIFPPTMSEYIDKVFSGQYVRPQRQGGTFMIVSKSTAYENKIKAKIAHCTQTLKFRDKFNNIIERPVVLKDEFAGDDIGYDQTINIPKGNMIFYCPIDEKTNIIDINDRFLFNGVPFKTNSVAKFVNDNNTGNPTIMKVSVFRDQRAEGDDVINNLPVTDIVYTIESDLTSISQTIGYTTQLNVVVKRNGDIYSTPIIFESSDVSIATISPTGVVNLLSNGNCSITVKMAENENISLVIPVVVSVVENTTIIFEPLVDKIYQGESQQYTVKKYIGDTLQPDILNITASGLNVLYYDLIITGNTFVVKNKKYSRTPLVITASDGVNSNSFNITLKGGF